MTNDHKHHHPHHHHEHAHDGTCAHDHPPVGQGLKWAFILNLSFAFLELGGGIWTNSMAITADALHDFGDALAIGLALMLEHYGNRRPDKEYTYGYRRYSVLGAAINAVILTVGSLFILKEAVMRLQNPPEVHAPAMIGFAVLGIAVNGYSAWRLSKSEGANQRMAMLHLLEDVLGWGIIFISAVLMSIYPMPILDPILSVALSLFVMWNVVKMGRKLLRIFMQRMPDELKMNELNSKVLALNGVKEMHAVQGWTLDGEEHTLSAHIKVSPSMTFQQLMDLKCQLKDVFAQHQIRYSTIEFESDENCCLEHGHQPRLKTLKLGGHHHHNH